MKFRIFYFDFTKIIFSLLCLFIFTEISPAQITFQKTYGGPGGEYQGVAGQSNDGGYFICGQTNFYGAGVWDVYFVKTDSAGNISWTKTYGGTGSEWANDVCQTNDGGYIIAGTTGSFGLNSGNVYLIKTDNVGNVTWSKMYGGISDESAFSVQQTSDSGYVMSGYTYSSGVGNVNFFVIKTNSSGDTLWTRSIGGNNDYSFSISQSNDGGYVVLGETFLPGIGDKDVYLVKLDGNGDLEWSKTYGGIQYERGYSIQQTNDNGYIITGQTQFGTGDMDVYLIKTNSSGDTLWTKTYGGSGSEFGFFVQQTGDDGFIITGRTNSFGAGGFDVYLLKTDSVGTYQWSKTYGGPIDDVGLTVRETGDNGFIIAGDSGSYANGGNLYLIKTDAYGNSGCNESNPNTLVTSPPTQVTIPATIVLSGTSMASTPTLVSSGGTVNTHCPIVGINEVSINNTLFVYQNPFTDELKLKGTKEKNSAIIFDTSGKEIMKCVTNDSETTITTEKILPGIYFLHYIENNQIANFKIIKF